MNIVADPREASECTPYATFFQFIGFQWFDAVSDPPLKVQALLQQIAIYISFQTVVDSVGKVLWVQCRGILTYIRYY